MPFTQTDLNRLKANDPTMTCIHFRGNQDDMYNEVDGVVDRASIDQLVQSVANNTYFDTLYISGRYTVEQGVVARLAEIPNLKKLSLRGCTLSPEDSSSLILLKGLEELDIGASNVTDDAILQLAFLPNLIYLNAEQNKIGAYGANSCAVGFPQLKFLSLYGNQIGNTGGLSLLAREKFVALDIRANKYTDTAIVQLASKKYNAYIFPAFGEDLSPSTVVAPPPPTAPGCSIT